MARTANPLTKVKKEVAVLKQKVDKVNAEISALSSLIDAGLKATPAASTKAKPRAAVGKKKAVKKPAVRKAAKKPAAKKAITAKPRKK